MPPNASGDFAKVWHARDEEARVAWQQQAKGILYEQGGEALLRFSCGDRVRRGRREGSEK